MRTIAVYADAFNGKVGQTLPYILFAKRFGNPRLVSPLDDPQEVVKNCDVLLMTGGADVDSSRYGEKPSFMTTRVNPHYEWLDKNIAQLFIDNKKPVLGICRGFQALNIMLGGTLHQHVIGHKQDYSRSSTNQTMNVYDNNGNLMPLKVNSIHHQAVRTLGKGLEPLGYTRVKNGCPCLPNHQLYLDGFKTENNSGHIQALKRAVPVFVEAFRHESLPIAAVQYHPEEFHCNWAIELFEDTINSTPDISEDKDFIEETQDLPEPQDLPGVGFKEVASTELGNNLKHG